MTKKHIKNNTEATIILKNGYLSILRGQTAVVATSDATSSHFIDAEQRGWISILDEAPTAETTSIVGVDVHIQKVDRGMTAEELRADLAATPTTTNEAIVTSLGQDPTSEVRPVTVEAIGQGDDTTEQVESSDKPARGRRKAA